MRGRRLFRRKLNAACALDRVVIAELIALSGLHSVNISGHLNQLFHPWSGKESVNIPHPPMSKVSFAQVL
jgi:hypothetical protein